MLLKFFPIWCRLACACAMFAFVACSSSKPEATKQPSSQRDVPEWPSTGDGLSLAGADASVLSQSYQGSIVFWHPTASPAAIAEVASASAANREKRAALAKFRLEKLDPLMTKKAAVASRLASLRDESQLKARATQRVVAAQWFDTMIANLLASQKITEQDANHAREVFGAYCDAKIWEFAAARLTVEVLPGGGAAPALRWSEQPSPAWLCESYYRAHGILERREGVHDETFVGDMWVRGVVLTRQFSARYDGAFAQRTDVLKFNKFNEWSADQTFELYLQGALASNKIRNALMSQKKVLPSSAMNIGGRINAEYADIFVPSTGTVLDSVQASLAQMSPGYLINAVEDLTLTPQATNPAQKIPTAALLIPGAVEDAQKAQILNDLRRTISTFQRREAGTASVSDYQLNIVANNAPVGMKEPVALTSRLQEPSLQEILAATDQELSKEIQVLEREEQTLVAAIADARQSAGPLEADWTAALNRGALAAAATGVSQAFFTSTRLALLVEDKPSDRILTVKVQLEKNSTPILACWSIAQQIQIACDSNLPLAAGTLQTNVELFVDHEATRIKLAVPMAAAEDAKALGFNLNVKSEGDDGVLSRAGGFNNAIDPLNIGGTKVVFDLFGNRLAQVLPFFTGKVFIKQFAAAGDASETLHEGATSLMPY